MLNDEVISVYSDTSMMRFFLEEKKKTSICICLSVCLPACLPACLSVCLYFDKA